MSPIEGTLGSESGAGPTAAPPAPPDAAPVNKQWRSSAHRSAAIYAAVLLGAIPATIATLGLSGSTFVTSLPTASVDLSYSFARMTAAYALSLGFALAYGYYAASRRNAEHVMIPILDILQSVPILGFFPVAIVLFIEIFGSGNWLGPNFASVFLIFTSMSWNMVFGVYESLKTMPPELKEAADSFGSSGIQRMRRVLYPATINRLVYNSILSWTGGWFFLVAAEIFAVGTGVTLPGIGSYLSITAGSGNASGFLAGLFVLVVLIAVLDFVVWRPLSRAAEKYRYDQAPSGEAELLPERGPRTQRAVAYVTRGVRGLSRIGAPFAQLAAYTSRTTRLYERPRTRSALAWIALGAVMVFAFLLLFLLGGAVIGVYTAPIPASVRSQMVLLPLAMGASALRVVAAFIVCMAIALPLALYLQRHPHAARTGLPMIEVVASFPATALFPVIVFVLVPYLTPEGASILMLLTGMVWYLFFNLLSGLRAIPPDLEEAARSFGLSYRDLVRKVLLPGSFAAIITGSITAFGGGWNTLIVAEYVQAGTRTFQVFGIGQMLETGYADHLVQGNALWVTALFVLVITVIIINELVWKPLYHRAVTKYRYD